MQLAGRLSAAISVLEDFERRRVPVKIALADWARGSRYAGARDRAWISGLCLDVLRRRNSLAAAMGDASPRAAVLACLRWSWDLPFDEVCAAAEGPHGPGPLSAAEAQALQQEPFSPAHAGAQTQEDPNPGRGDEGGFSIAGDFPGWLAPHVMRVFGDDAIVEMQALARRADVDLRINTLKAAPDKALDALRTIGATPAPILKTAARVAAPPPSERTPQVTVIPAFNKGWVEVQDLGSQIAAAAAGAIKGAQVLDYCAGGGGKTLALASLMENTGQLYAYDPEPRRLKEVYERARRAGVRNLQIRNPAGGDALDDLKCRMNLVFVDAPCTGSGTWRRHPDSKWRLTPQQLEARIVEQDAILKESAAYVKPGGRLVYVTCSIFMEENEDRLAAFRSARPDFKPIDAIAEISASTVLAAGGRAQLEPCCAAGGALRLTPARVRTDGFFIVALLRTTLVTASHGE
jgi:16S rRNA (cytosine967-C5)-methyltransferase